VFDTNVLGAYIVAREAARALSNAGGSIVNVSSMASKLGSPGEYVDYAGSKGAIDTLTIGLSKELGPKGIRVNAVRPGIIDTDIHGSVGRPERVAELGPNCPLGRAGKANEVANLIYWLLSDDASYVTGALIDISGGR
jgi:NAD(P)-dependent dehydrogenase (short-subunit alcohol dehydrogenase family)